MQRNPASLHDPSGELHRNSFVAFFATTAANGRIRSSTALSLNLRNTFNIIELDRVSTVPFFVTVQDKGERKVEYLNLDAIISKAPISLVNDKN